MQVSISVIPVIEVIAGSAVPFGFVPQLVHLFPFIGCPGVFMNDAVAFTSAFIRFGTVFLPIRTDITSAPACGTVAFYDRSIFTALADFIFANRGVPEPGIAETRVGVKAPGGFDADPEGWFTVVPNHRRTVTVMA